MNKNVIKTKLTAMLTVASVFIGGVLGSPVYADQTFTDDGSASVPVEVSVITPSYSITLPAIITECKDPNVQHANASSGQYGHYIVDVPVHLEMENMGRYFVDVDTAGGKFGDGFLASPGYDCGMVSALWNEEVDHGDWTEYQARNYTQAEIEADPEGTLETLFEKNRISNFGGGFRFLTNTDWLPETTEREEWSDSAGTTVPQQCTLTRFPVNVGVYKDVSPAANELSDSVFRSEYLTSEQISDCNENGYQDLGGSQSRLIVPDGEIDFDLQLMACKKELYKNSYGEWAIQNDGATIGLVPYTASDPLPTGSYSGEIEVSWRCDYYPDDMPLNRHKERFSLFGFKASFGRLFSYHEIRIESNISIISSAVDTSSSSECSLI